MAFPPSQPIDFVEEDYIGFYNRAGDAPGANFWVNQLNTSNSPLGVAVGFAVSSESTAIYPYLASPNVLDPTQYITQIYTNVLGRAPDGPGLAFWGNELNRLNTLYTGPNNTVVNLPAGTKLPNASVDPKVVAAAELLTEMLQSVNMQSGTADAQLMANRITVAEDYTTKTGDANVPYSQSSSHAVILATNSDPASVTAAELITTAYIATAPNQTFTLTPSIDQGTPFVGGAGNDVYLATLGAAPTLNSFDSIDGVGGINSLNISGTTAGGDRLPSSITLANIQHINLVTTTNAGNSAANPFDVSPFGSVTDVNVISSGTHGDFIKASATENITDVSQGAGNFVQTIGGNAVNVTSSGSVTIGGAAGNPAGAVTVVNTSAPGAAINIDGGTAVNVQTNGAGVAIGANVAPTGAVAVTANVGSAANTAVFANPISVHGGSTVTVTENATEALATATAAPGAANGAVFLGGVTVTGGSATTAVTVNQTPAAAAVNSVSATAALTETGSAVFAALTAGQTLTVDGLTFTAATALTAAQVASAFANLSAGATQGAAASTLGTYTGTYNGAFTSGPVTGTSSVLFTSTGTGNVPDLSTLVGGTGTAPTISETNGIPAVTATGTVGVFDGTVQITDANYGTASANTIANVTLGGYGTTTISSDALTKLSLANSAAAVTVNNHTATALDLTLNKTTGGIGLDGGTPAKYTNLAVHVAGTSADAITASGVTALTVDGSAVLNATGSTLTALNTVAVSGSAGLTLASVASVTDINAAATSGAMTITNFDASKATYEGGSGVDNLTLSNATVTKAISLGDGNDTLTLAPGTTVLNVDVNGGNGTDTVVMNTADAAAGSASSLFAAHVKGFEVLSLNTAGSGAQLIHIDTMGINSVTTSGENAAGVLNLDGFSSGGTLTETGTNSGTISITSAAFTAPTNDMFHIVLSAAGGLTGGIVDLTNVEAATIAANNTTANAVANTVTDHLTLSDLSGTPDLSSITVTGNAHLLLTVAGDTALTSIDASGMTGGLQFVTAGTLAETVKGGASSNTLVANSGATADTLIGGAGNDVIAANQGLDTLTGNGGNDLFVVTNGAPNVNTYSTITDANLGDTLALAHLSNNDVFTATKVTLANTATLQDYANAVVNAGGDSSANAHIGWFQFNNGTTTDTYVVESLHNATTTTNFTNGTDIIVKLQGIHDLSTASLHVDGGGTIIGLV